MAFKKVMSLIGGAIEVAPPKDNASFLMTNAEAAVAGRVYKFSRIGEGNYRLTAAITANKDAALIGVDSMDAGTDVKTRAAWITPDAVYKAPLTNKANNTQRKGSDVHADVRVGATLNINDLGDGVDGQTDLNAAHNALSVVKVDRTNGFVWVVFNTTFLTSRVT